MNNSATAAQARFVTSLADQVGPEIFNEAFKNACRLNGNTGIGDTITQKVRRLSKKAASQLINDLLAVRDGNL